MDPSKNPFAPHAGAPPPQLAGREWALGENERILGRLAAGRSSQGIVLAGLRGVGKTVLLRLFSDAAQARRLESVMLEATEDGEFPRLLARHLRPLLLRAQRGNAVSQAVKRSLAAFKGFSFTVDQTGSLGFGIEVGASTAPVADTGDLEFDLSDLFTSLGESARDRRTGLLIAIDEMQYLREDELGALLAAFHRSVQYDLPLVLCGAGLPNIRAQIGRAKTYAERQFQWGDLGALSRDEVNQAVNGAATRAGVTFDDGAIDEIFESTRGYPFFVQEWAHDVWNYASGPTVTGQDVREATPLVHDRLDGFFRMRFDRLTPREQLYLASMAQLGDGSHGSGEIADVVGAEVTALARTRDGLIRKGMIYSPRVGQAAFSAPLFDRYLRENVDLNTLRTAAASERRRGR